MEESNQKSTRPPKNVCEKLYRAISVTTSPIRTFHRISFPHQHETSPIISDGGGGKAKLVRSKSTEAPIPSKVDSKTPRGILVTDSNRSTRPEKAPAAVKVIRQNKPGKIIEDRFSEFIDRAKLKMMNMSNAGEEKISSTVPIADHKDHFSEYIKRAKQRLRNTSSMKPRN